MGRQGQANQRISRVTLLLGLSFSLNVACGEQTLEFQTQARAMGAPLPFVEDFEATALSMDWTTYSSNTGRVRLLTLYQPQQGNRHLVMDDAVADTSNSYNEAVLNVNLSGASNVSLQFWARESSDEDDQLPLTFTGRSNGEGVAISSDNTNWYRIVDFTTLTNTYEFFDIDIDAAIAAGAAAGANLSFSQDFYIRFSQYDDYTMDSDGILIDNLVIGENLPELTPPTGTLLINAGAAQTNSAAVTLTVTATDADSGVSGISFSNDGTTWTPWQAYNPIMGSYDVSWDITDAMYGGNTVTGSRTVYYRIQDNAQNVSDTVTATILYAPPVSYAVLPFTDSFESGGLENWWRGNSSTNGRIRVQTTYPADGSYSVLMDTSSGYALNELILYLDLTGETDVWLTFQARDFGDETNTLPVTYTGSANGDGVAVSTDGTNWYRVLDIGPLLSSSFQTLTASLDTVNQTHGLSFGPDYRIKFTQYDNASITTDGIAYDDVKVRSFANDMTAPTGTVSFSSSNTTVLAVTLNSDAIDDTGFPVANMRFSNDGVTWSPWEAYSTTRTLWDLSDARYGGTTVTGTKPVYAQYDDGRGNFSQVSTANVNYQPPATICDITTSNSVLTVAGTLNRTNLCRNTNCELDQYVFDGYANRFITGMALNSYGQPGTVTVNANSTDFDTTLYVYDIGGGGCTLLGSNNDSGMSTDSEVTVPVAANGVYWVVVSSTAAFSNGSYSVSASGQLTDISPPSGTITIFSETVLSPLVNLSLSATDSGGLSNAGSGVTEMSFSNDGMTFGPWVPYATTYTGWDISDPANGGTNSSGAKSVYVRYRDAAGNISSVNSDNTTYLLPTAATLPFSDSFSSTSLGSSWVTNSTLNGRIRVSSSNTPSSSPYHVLMDSTSGYALNELILCVDLTMSSNVEIIFQGKEFSDESNALPISFTGSANGDGVAVSDDGINWVSVSSLTNLTSTYSTRTVDLSQAIANNSNLSATSRFFIKFTQYDNNPITTDGIALDDISVGEADTTPPTGTVSINSGALSTTNPVVTLSLSATDNVGGSGVSAMRFSNNGTTWTNWQVYGPSSPWNLSANGGNSNPGTKTVYAQFRDNSGNASQSFTDAIVYQTPDMTAPTGSIQINAGASQTSAVVVSLNLSATDNMGGSGVDRMRFSNDGSTWSTWQAYVATRPGWDITATAFGGDSQQGTKTVYAQFVDVAGNVSTSYSDTILFQVSDTTPPTGTVSINSGALSTTNPVVTINVAATDNMGGSGVADAQFSLNGSAWTVWNSYATAYSGFDLTLATLGGTSQPGTKTVYARFRDIAGNVSQISNDTIEYVVADMTPPSGSIAINGGAATTQTLIVNLGLLASDNVGGSGVSDMQFSNNGSVWTAWESYASNRTGWNLGDVPSGGNTQAGTKTAYVRFRDGSGNVSIVASASIDYVPPDTISPVGSLRINGGAMSTNTNLVNLNCSAQDETSGSGVADMQFSNNATAWSTWETFSTSKVGWDLTSAVTGGDASYGTKIVFARYRDAAGNESPIYDAQIEYINDDTEAPTQPTDVNATAVSSSQIVISWTASSDNVGLAHYIIEQGFDEMNLSRTTTVASNAYSADNLMESTEYFFRVTAVDTAGNESFPSEVVSATTRNDIPGVDAGFVDVGFSDSGIMNVPDGGGEPVADAGTSTTGGNSSSTRRRTRTTPGDEGCSCAVSTRDNSTTSVGLLIVLLGLVVATRRRQTE